MRQILLLMLLLLVVCTVTPGAADSINWVKWTGDGSNGHWYALVTQSQSMTWIYAQSQALFNGGHLATVTTALENSFILDKFAAGMGYGAWLGGYQNPADTLDSHTLTTKWNWVTVEEFVFEQNWGWNPGEPNDASGNTTVDGGYESYLGYRSTNNVPSQNYGWNDYALNDDGQINKYVLESSVSPVPEAGTVVAVCSILSPSFLFFRRRRK